MNIKSRPVHIDLCETLPVLKKCYTCYRSSINASQKRLRALGRAAAAAMLQIKIKTIYKSVLCKNCEDKGPKYVCKDCKTKYMSAKNRKYRQNACEKASCDKIKEINLGAASNPLENPINDLGLVQTTNTSRVITKKVKPMKEKSNQMQTPNEIKSVLKKGEGNCNQNNHTNLPSMAQVVIRIRKVKLKMKLKVREIMTNKMRVWKIILMEVTMRRNWRRNLKRRKWKKIQLKFHSR